MYPTLSNRGSYILHSPLALWWSAPTRGELVTAISPLDPSHQVLKRIIGLGGDEVLVDPTGERGLVAASEMVRVPKGYVWLAGDNASNSTDSRDYGPVPLGLLKGKVVARVSAWNYCPVLGHAFRVADTALSMRRCGPTLPG